MRREVGWRGTMSGWKRFAAVDDVRKIRERAESGKVAFRRLDTSEGQTYPRRDGK
jgi:hypothetical protein